MHVSRRKATNPIHSIHTNKHSPALSSWLFLRDSETFRSSKSLTRQLLKSPRNAGNARTLFNKLHYLINEPSLIRLMLQRIGASLIIIKKEETSEEVHRYTRSTCSEENVTGQKYTSFITDLRQLRSSLMSAVDIVECQFGSFPATCPVR